MQVINTKLCIPPTRARLVERSGLIEKLNQGVARGFVLVSAPAGYGKSTLLSSWLSQVDFPCAWISLDAKDNDLERFLTYLAAALQMADSSAPQILGDKHDLSTAVDSEALLTPMINHLAKSEDPLCLVLDDYHVIQNQAVHQAVNFLLEQRPTSLCLVISTRADPPLPLARLRARSAVLELRQSDLCFTIQESASFLNHTMALQVSGDDIQNLTERTEGWIAGLQMAGLSLQGKTEISKFIHTFNGENRYILSFLFDEVFQDLPNETQIFLLQTSLLERLCSQLCDAVTHRNDSQLLLETLERNNLFLIALDDKKEWYRYHNLFAELLRNRLTQTQPQTKAQLHKRARVWFAQQNDLENAITHALAEPDYKSAATLIEQLLQNMDLINRQPLLASWIDTLPQEIQNAHPWLCAHRAYGDYWTGYRDRAEDWLQKAEKASTKIFDKSSPDFLQLQGFIASVRAHTALGQENIHEALEMAHKALNLLPAGHMMHTTTRIALGAAYWADGDVVQSEQAFSSAQLQALKINNSFAIAPTCYMGIQQIKQGRLQDALNTFRDGLKLATLPDGQESVIAGFANIKIGDVLRQRNQLEEASRHLQYGMDQCLRLQQVDFLADAYVCLGRYQLATGDLAGTLESIEKADHLARYARIDQWVLCWLDDLRVRHWLSTGKLNLALQWSKFSGLSPDGPLSYLHDLHHQNLARILVAQNALEHSKVAYDQAAGLLDRLLAATRKAGWVHEEIILLVLQVTHEQAHGRPETALQSLSRAVWLAAPGGYVRVFLDEGKVVQTMLIRLADRLTQEQRQNHSQKNHSSLQYYVAMLQSSYNPEVASQVGHPTTSSTLQTPHNQHQQLVDQLSHREFEILKLLALGNTDKNIAQKLVISPQTVHKHLKNIYGKLSVHSRTEAIAHARDLKLL